MNTYDDLRKAAEVVLRGPWSAVLGHVIADETDEFPQMNINCRNGNKDDAKKLARYIANAQPATILQLLADLDAARVDAERYRKLITHRPVLLVTGFFGNGCVNYTIKDAIAAIDQLKGK